jgi:hypothetical protein
MRFSVVLLLIFSVSTSWAKKLSDYSPYEYDVRFTNPVCKTYKYEEPIESRSGDWLTQKPKNAYCRKDDATKSGERQSSPQSKLLSWINDPNTSEIFFTYLSFSNKEVKEALCTAIEERDVKVRFVLDSGTSLTQAESLLDCQASDEELNPELYLRGHVSGVGYAHNKIFIINPSSEDEIKIAFGSGNMSSGIVLHHENWHFVTTDPESHFAQSHLCVMNAEIFHATSGRKFRSYMRECLGEIANEPEEDIKIFFVPGQGKEATEQIADALYWAEEVKLAAHRFSYNDLIEMLEDGLKNSYFNLRLVFDDDLFWVGQPGTSRRPNTRHEYRKAQSLIRLGADARYIETNHRHHLLHHNKFIVFKSGERRAAFFGAGNFTGTAFSTNLENFYYVEIPKVAKAMSRQFEHLFNDLGTAEKDLPLVETAP